MTDREIAIADLESLKKGVKKDDKYGKESWGDMGKRIVWNGTAPYTSEGGKAIVPTAIKAGQEVIYSKILRKFLKADNKSWLGLTMFSLLTAVFDEGLGAWYGEHKRPQDQGLSDVAMEFPRPILSCLAINYIMNVAYMGIHNPMRSFGFKELLIQLAAKDLAEGGNAIMAQNFRATGQGTRTQTQTVRLQQTLPDQDHSVPDHRGEYGRKTLLGNAAADSTHGLKKIYD